eukprot:TRINITY_DN22370_c0_g1_i3.p1 TRINITY_DN22370_c0_g1~~TRINITY_DN22370_c0_g1_i3.p1  ORF type:complete len:624 (+),score=150.37 TRINITY_DN22370_c0_g1_i3:153-2024(+)
MAAAAALAAHGYEPVQQLPGSTSATVILVRGRRIEDDGDGRDVNESGGSTAPPLFVVKTFALGAADAGRKRNALQEIHLLKRLRHPHIIRFVEFWWNGVGPDSGRLTVVMEYAEGGDLRAPMEAASRQGVALDEVVVKLWLRQMLQALDFIHGRSIVHRDLKAMNVFLKDNWRRCLLADFGISTVLSGATPEASGCAGTPAYMSPELVWNARYSTCVDLWALGIILYELMALKLPFSAPSLLAIVYQIAFREHDPEPLRANGYSQALISLVARLLAKDPSSRPTAREVLSEGSETRASFEGYHEVFELFRSFDLNGNGLIERSELIAVLQALDPTVWTDDRVDRLLKAADTDGDGLIDAEEFLAWVLAPSEDQSALCTAMGHSPSALASADGAAAQAASASLWSPLDVERGAAAAAEAHDRYLAQQATASVRGGQHADLQLPLGNSCQEGRGEAVDYVSSYGSSMWGTAVRQSLDSIDGTPLHGGSVDSVTGLPWFGEADPSAASATAASDESYWGGLGLRLRRPDDGEVWRSIRATSEATDLITPGRFEALMARLGVEPAASLPTSPAFAAAKDSGSPGGEDVGSPPSRAAAPTDWTNGARTADISSLAARTEIMLLRRRHR